MVLSMFSILMKVLIATVFILLCFLTITLTQAEQESTSPPKVMVEDPKLMVEDPKLMVGIAVPNSISASHIYSMAPSRRTNKSLSISIIIVYTQGTPLENYATALNSVECYGKLHGYPFHLFSDSTYSECTKHKDLFFRRHCCIAKFMEREMNRGSWLLVLDGDIAVVNPNILIEKFIDANYDITLFDRFFNFEVGANSYLVRNTERGRAFVQGFADYEFKLPKSFHGTDNGALHPYLVELLAPENSRIVDSLCAKIWRNSKNYKTLFDMEVCTRLIFGDRTHFAQEKLRIISKGKAWVRDVWLLKNRWADDDFMLHAVKEKQLQQLGPEIKSLPDSQLYQWDPTNDVKRIFPLTQKLNISECALGSEQWTYDSRLKISNEKKATLLNTMEAKIFKKRLETIGRLAGSL